MIQKKCYHVDDINKRYYVHEIDCEDVIYQTNENWTTLMKLGSFNMKLITLILLVTWMKIFYMGVDDFHPSLQKI